MARVFLADPLVEERSAFRVLLLDLRMELAGEASDWLSLYSQAGPSCPDMILVSWELLPKKYVNAIDRLRKNCPDARIVVIVNQEGDCQDMIETSGVDAVISKEDFPYKVVDILRMAVADKDSSRR